MRDDRKLIAFCENVRYLRKQHRLTQKEMAQKLHIGISSLRALERGCFPPRLGVEMVFYIHKQFGVPPKRIFAPLQEMKENQ